MAKKDCGAEAPTPVDVFKQALTEMGIKPIEVFAHKEYSDQIVIVTKSGQKRIWRKSECHIQ